MLQGRRKEITIHILGRIQMAITKKSMISSKPSTKSTKNPSAFENRSAVSGSKVTLASAKLASAKLASAKLASAKLASAKLASVKLASVKLASAKLASAKF